MSICIWLFTLFSKHPVYVAAQVTTGTEILPTIHDDYDAHDVQGELKDVERGYTAQMEQKHQEQSREDRVKKASFAISLKEESSDAEIMEPDENRKKLFKVP